MEVNVIELLPMKEAIDVMEKFCHVFKDEKSPLSLPYLIYSIAYNHKNERHGNKFESAIYSGYQDLMADPVTSLMLIDFIHGKRTERNQFTDEEIGKFVNRFYYA